MRITVGLILIIQSILYQCSSDKKVEENGCCIDRADILFLNQNKYYIKPISLSIDTIYMGEKIDVFKTKKEVLHLEHKNESEEAYPEFACPEDNIFGDIGHFLWVKDTIYFTENIGFCSSTLSSYELNISHEKLQDINERKILDSIRNTVFSSMIGSTIVFSKNIDFEYKRSTSQAVNGESFMTHHDFVVSIPSNCYPFPASPSMDKK